MNVLTLIGQVLSGIFADRPRYMPIIPPHTREQMRKYNISESELVGAFNSPTIKKGYKTGSTLGIAEYYGKVVCAVYKRDDNDRNEWVIIGCSSYEKKTSDPVTGRRYWKSWHSRRPWELRPRKPFSLF